MIIIVHHTAHVNGTASKSVQCEQCGMPFQYQIRRAASATADSFYGIAAKWTQNRAHRKATRLLEQKLEQEFDVVPCPTCGWYQKEMVLHLQQNHLAWLGRAGGALTFVAIVAGALAFLITLAGNEQLKSISGVLWTFAGAMAAVGVVSLALRSILSSRRSPNAMNREQVCGQ